MSSTLRFTVGYNSDDDVWYVGDSDFGYDARLTLTGDFPYNADKDYAEAVAFMLNGVAVAIPTKNADSFKQKESK